jgi:hypothetical protein
VFVAQFVFLLPLFLHLGQALEVLVGRRLQRVKILLVRSW